MSPAQPTPAVKAELPAARGSELAHQPRPETAARPAAVERLLIQPGFGPAAVAELERWDLFTYHWPLHGLGLNDRILKKVYSGNAQKLVRFRK